MFKKMMILCLVVMCVVSNFNPTVAKAEQVCGAEEYQKIINGVAELYGEFGIMKYSVDSTISAPGNGKIRILVNYRYDFKKGVYTGVSIYSTGKKVVAKCSFTYSVSTDKVKYKELVNKDIEALDYIKSIIYSKTEVDNAIDVVGNAIDLLEADDSNVVEKTKTGLKGTVIDKLDIKTKFNISTSDGLKNIVLNAVNSKNGTIEKLKVTMNKIG